MPINKQDLRNKISELRKVANNPILNALGNTFTRISRGSNITLDTTRDQIYDFVIVYKEIRTWEKFSDNSEIINNLFREVYGKDIITKDTFMAFVKDHPPRRPETNDDDEPPTKTVSSSGESMLH